MKNIWSCFLALSFIAHSYAEPAPTPVKTDILVYSGAPCGIAAAIVSAREGAQVLLIEPEKHVGGLSTSGINTAESEHMLKWTIGGFADEFYRRLGKHYGSDKPEYYFESNVANKVYDTMLKEAGVKIHHGARVDRVSKDGARITSITLTDGTVVEAGQYIDASYEGDLMARAGVDYHIGREAKSEFNEEAAGIRFDKTIRHAPTTDDQGNLLPGISGWVKDFKEGDAHPAPMNYNFRFTISKDPAQQVPFPAPKHYDAQRYTILANWLQQQKEAGKTVKFQDIIDLYKRPNGRYEMNNKQAAIFSLGHFGGQFEWSDASYEKRQAIFDDHMNYSLGLIHFLANDPAVPENIRAETKSIGLHNAEFIDNDHLPYQLYVREARRMRGQYVVTQQDVTSDRRKSDSIGISSHFIDSHHVQRLALSPTEFLNEGRIWRMGYAYQIPYCALTPKSEQATNLLVPGAASYTHVAFCTLRLESVWMITGHAAGLAAHQALKNQQSVQSIDVATLQQKLRDQNQVIDFIPGEPEKATRLNGPPEF